jgi:hypothetical protein
MATTQFGGCLGDWWQRLVTLGTERPRLAIVAPLITTWLSLFLKKNIGKIKHMLVQCH